MSIDELHLIEVREPGRLPVLVVVTDRLPLGRACEGVLLGDSKVSRAHVELRPLANGIEVRDLDSSNGTRVNGIDVVAPRPVGPGDVIELGDTRVVVAPTLAPPGDGTDGIDRAISSTVVIAKDDLQEALVGSTLTIVFSDIVSSTSLNHEIGDRAWVELLQRHDELLREQLERYQGRAVKGQGDGFLLTFPSARHGLVFSIALQRQLESERRRSSGFPLQVRMGVHTGEVLHQDGDVFGGHVNFAARIAAHAGANEVLVSQLAHDLVRPMGDLGFDEPRRVELKGFPGAHDIHPLRWREEVTEAAGAP